MLIIVTPNHMLPSLVLSNALEVRHGHGHVGHGGPLPHFFQRASPPSPSNTMSQVHLQWPVLLMHFTCNGRLPFVKPYTVHSRRCSNERHIVTTTATKPGVDGVCAGPP
jgi:hypothetical protein